VNPNGPTENYPPVPVGRGDPIDLSILKETRMLLQPLFDKLTQLRLPAFREGLHDQLQNPQYSQLAFEERLALLVDQECTRRTSHRLQRRLVAAAFPFPALIEDLDLSSPRGLDRRVVLELSQGTWVEHHLNVIIEGPTGAGKTYLACALGQAACRTNFTVRYFRTSRLLQQMARAHQEGTSTSLLARLAQADLIILDDWMRDAITLAQAQDLLEIMDDRYGRASTLVATQVPVAEYHARFPDPVLADAILDRLVHNAHRLNLIGESQRKTRSTTGRMPSTDV
jgi:DNA replication protein DnaC